MLGAAVELGEFAAEVSAYLAHDLLHARGGGAEDEMVGTGDETNERAD